MKIKNRFKKPLAIVRHPNSLALLLLIGCLVAAWQLLLRSGLTLQDPAALVQSINQLGLVGKLAFSSLLALAIVVSPIPGTPLTIAAGAIWGPWIAGWFGVLGIFLGSLIVYFLGRTLGRSAVRTLTGKAIFLSKHKGEMYLGWIVFITHLLPITPFDLVSYGAGLAKLSFKIYAISTLLGTIPGTFLLAYMGSSLTINLPTAIAMGLAALGAIAVLIWGVRKHHWLGIQDVLRIE